MRKKKLTDKDKERIRKIRTIHLTKLADKVDVSDIKVNPNRKTTTEIFAERECGKCGVLGKTTLCQACKDFLSTNKRLEKPDVFEASETNIDIDIEVKKHLTDTSAFKIFTKEDILHVHIDDWVYSQSFLKYIRDKIAQGVLEKVPNKGAPKYRLTQKGLQEFNNRG